ncbi:unnamed protein product [Urochloa decumbens]|uniref:RING-type domain-containing protein n=1 Tax=Urochloa decumbens TaxID=240449 RepID=A0ABC9H6X4_9POAL
MAAAGGRRRLLVVLPEPPLVEPNNYGQSQGNHEAYSGDVSTAPSWVFALVLVVSLVVALVVWLCCCLISKKAEEDEEDSVSHDERQPEVAVDIESPPPPPLDCTWKDGTCSVCLGDLVDDGEALKMLMPCKHCFHAACVDQWLRKSATCPICRAPTAKPKAGRRRT